MNKKEGFEREIRDRYFQVLVAVLHGKFDWVFTATNNRREDDLEILEDDLEILWELVHIITDTGVENSFELNNKITISDDEGKT